VKHILTVGFAIAAILIGVHLGGVLIGNFTNKPA
jgi:hypothetical protein